MLGLSLSVSAIALRRAHGISGEWTPPPSGDTVTALWLGQSEIEYLLNSGSFYRNIPQPPVPAETNLVVFGRPRDGNPPVRVEVNAAQISAGNVNPAMAALSGMLAHAAPGKLFVIGDAAVAGTSREGLQAEPSASRPFADLVAVVDMMEAEFGPVQVVTECWYNSDATAIGNFRNNFWPLYFKANGNGTPFTLGTVGPRGRVDVCLWDATVAPDQKGEGIFRRDQTKWQILTPMPFNNGPSGSEPEAANFSYGGRLQEPDRAVMIDLTSDPIAQSVNLEVGPSAHISNFGGGIHPITNDPDGQILLLKAFAVAMLRQAGVSMAEPMVVDCEAPADGSFADLVVSLPNGGTLTTLRQFRGHALPATPSPHQQIVTGIELSRGATRRPVFRTDNTDAAQYPTTHRGTVTITDTGSGTPRRGRVRVTPEQPFTFGDSLSYLRGQATAMLLRPRDTQNRLYLDHLIEHVPGVHDTSAMYPHEGIAVRPFQQDIAVPLAAPAFNARGATFDGAKQYMSTSESIAGGPIGAISLWVRLNEAQSWNTVTNQHFIELRTGSTIRFFVRNASNGQAQINVSGVTSTTAFRAEGNTNFESGRWYHILAAWNAGTFRLYVDDVVRVDTTWDGPSALDGREITRVAIAGTGASGNRLNGSLAHLWCSVTQSFDISDPTVRAKFINSGAPVDLGANGQLITGTAPEWYYDGEGMDFINRGTAGNIPLAGPGADLTAAPLPIP